MNGILIHSGDRPWVTIVRVRGRCPVTPIEAGGGQWSPSGQCPPCVRVAVLLRHSPLITNIHHKHQRSGAQTTTISLLKTGKKAERKMLERGLMTKGNAGCGAATAGRGAGRVSLCHSPGPSAGADVAAADSGQRGHRSPRRIGCDWWRCGVRCRHSGPRLHWPPILPVSGVSAAWAAPSLTLQTIHGLGPVFLPAGSLLAAGHWTPAWVWSWA